jgi:hypothetical protein
MSIQILQYEFLGPIKLQEWGPPMQKTVYLILSREKDSFKMIYAGLCEQTEDKTFLTSHSSFRCWITESGSEKLLYLAILPLFKSEIDEQKRILGKIITRYQPICNIENIQQAKSEYSIRPSHHSQNDVKAVDKTSCPCCGSEMKVDQIFENTTVIRCVGCELTDTRFNS